jgi:hypothetical protein
MSRESFVRRANFAVSEGAYVAAEILSCGFLDAAMHTGQRRNVAYNNVAAITKRNVTLK